MTLSENERTLTSHQQPPYISRLFFHFSCFLLLGEQSKAKQNKNKYHKNCPIGGTILSILSILICWFPGHLLITGRCDHCFTPFFSIATLSSLSQSLLSTWILSQHNVSYHFFLNYIRMINSVEFIASLLHLVFAMDILYANLLISLFPTLNPNKMGMIPGRRKNKQARMVDITYVNFGHSYA